MDPIISYILSLLLIAFSFLLLLKIGHRKLQKDATLPPGPWPIPVIGNLHMLGTRPNRALRDMAKKYGPIMSIRLGNVPAIVVSSPETARLVLKTHDSVLSSRPKLQVAEYFTFGNKDMVFAPYGPYWRSLRRLTMTQLMNPAKVESFGPMRREEVGRLVGKIKAAAAAREVVDVSAELDGLACDMGCRMILGCTSRERANLKYLVREIMNLAGAFNIADYMPFLAPFDLQGLTKRTKVAQKAIDSVLEEIINESESKPAPEDGRNFVDILVSLNNKPHDDINSEMPYVMERENIKAIIEDMLLGSSESSSVTVDWALSELIRNPHIMARVQEELEAIVGVDRMVEETDLPKLSYLEMVVKETFRLHPVAPLLVPHESIEDVTINGYYIPKKTRIMVNAFAIGRDPKVWSDNAEEFFPERFVGSNIDFKEHNFQLIPFGSGRRACPGMQVGLANVRFILAQLVHCFTWELPNGMSPEDLDMAEQFGLSVPRASHLLLKPTYRLYT